MSAEQHGLPETLEAAVYDALLGSPGSSGDVDGQLEQLCAEHPAHAEVIRRLAARVRAGERSTAVGPFESAPSRARIGRYTLHEELGRGGFGVVYRAEQDAPLARSVALKVLAPGLDAAAIHARFDLERQLLARLTHPNIAKIHDAGTTPEGRPWFAMELIDGPPITEWCSSHTPDVRATIELFLTACDAVQHAHQQGVIHRDVKPSNVLVATVDGQPVAKVIDFGVAKALDQPVDGSVAATLDGAVIGTPEYMSPEQARGEPADVRSDVFGLGALLYRLLTGSAPRDLTRRGTGSPAAILAEISTIDPERPSRRAVSSAPDRVRRLRGDLDWICLTALRRNPDQRYAAVAELARDLRAHLDGRPIGARPPSFGYLVATIWRRHRARLLAAGAAALLLVTTSIATTALWLDARRQENLATARARQLDAAFAQLQEITDPLRAEDRAEYADAELWPALPESIPAFETWLAEARTLAARMESTAAGAAEQRRLVETIAAVEGRLAVAAGIAQRGATDAAAWKRATAELATDPRFAGFTLGPQPGLVPIGPDPRSGLQEFAHLLSGELPHRGPDGELRPTVDDAIVLVLVPGGAARLGAQSASATAPHYDPDAGDDEGPVHEVDLEPFLIAKWEVSQAQWQRMTGGENPSHWHDRVSIGGVAHSLLHPVEQVSWDEAVAVLARHDLALPTEAAWEYAARAGADDRWLGATSAVELARRDNIADRRFGQRSPAGTAYESDADDGYVLHAPIGSFAPNAFGLYDVLGNVYEWTSGLRFDYTVPATPGRGERSAARIQGSLRGQRVFRGGAYNSVARIVRVSRRSIAPKDARSSSIGVRPVRWLAHRDG
ncbi:MAG: SUMF1/EgtB/PvdO family nonheme iron enzyme [Planctomycetes bacterium]|nr:SUMF1/EgtB/PvdO family nonheme iron enzyme [Planctomycetota bacterium]